jgi:hypothetical protein
MAQEENAKATPKKESSSETVFQPGKKVFANVNATGNTHIKMFGYVGGDEEIAFANNDTNSLVATLSINIKQNLFEDFKDMGEININNLSIESAKALEKALKLAIATAEGRI